MRERGERERERERERRALREDRCYERQKRVIERKREAEGERQRDKKREGHIGCPRPPIRTFHLHSNHSADYRSHFIPSVK